MLLENCDSLLVGLLWLPGLTTQEARLFHDKSKKGEKQGWKIDVEKAKPQLDFLAYNYRTVNYFLLPVKHVARVHDKPTN